MAQCFLAKSGGVSMKETLLWTNSNPTSNFEESTIALNEPYTNFKFIKIEYRVSTSDGTSISAIFSKEDVAKSTTANNTPVIGLCSRTSAPFARMVYQISTNQIKFSRCKNLDNASADASKVIPTNIYGIK